MTTVQLRHLRIFMASPGDVTHERELALTVLDQLPYEPSFRGRITIEAVAWDKKGAGAPILANLTPQDSIKLGLPTPAECDIVVVIFWARMGTPLPSQYLKADGSRYLSGTEWEYENAIEASKKGDGPAVLLYRRTEPLMLNPDDPGFEEKTKQYRSVKQFFDSLVNDDGSIKNGYNPYESPSDFKEALELHLKTIIETLIRSSRPDQSSSSQTVPPAWPTSPFPGLRAFKPADAPIFFGRERETDALVKRVAENSVIAIVGASGSGKSSLVGAGLIPRLLLTSGNEGWLPVTTTPDYLGSGNPFTALAASLLRDLEPVEQPELATALSKNDELLAEICQKALERRSPETKALLFIDQFEELFTTIAPSYRQAYVNMLVKTALRDHVRIVLTLRGDFYGKCVELPQLAKLLEDSTYPLSVPGMAALYEMITRPASRADLHFEEGLAQRILDDTGDEPGSLALMAYMLDELYRLSTKNERLLTHHAYEELGGVQGAIGKRSESVFVSLDEHERAALPQVFRELVEVDDRGTATRLRASLNRAAKTEEAASLIKALTDARLLVQSRGENNEPFVEVAHEALLRSWERLVEWIKDTQDDLRLLRQVRIAAREWDENGRRDDFLWSQERLEPVYAMRDRLGVDFEPVTLNFIRPEVERLLQEFMRHYRYFEQRKIIQRFGELGTLSIACAVLALPYAVSKSAKRDLYALLGKYPDEAVPILIRSLSIDKYSLRALITELLATQFPTSSVDTLATLLKDKNSLIRSYAAIGLAGSEDPKTIRNLTGALEDSDRVVRQISIIELAGFGIPQVLEPLLKVLNSKDKEMASLSAYLIGVLGNTTQRWNSRHLRKAYTLPLPDSDDNRYELVDQAIARANGELSGKMPPKVLDALVRALSDDNEALRKSSASALGLIGDPSSVTALVKRLKDKDVGVVLSALEALGHIPHKSVVPSVIDALSSESGDVRVAAAALAGRLSNGESFRRKRANKGLDAAATARLVKLLETDPDVQVRRQAVISIGQIAGKSALQSILKAAQDKDTQLRANAIFVMGRIGDRSLTPTLIGALNDGSLEVQTNALEALGNIGDPGVIPDLLELFATLESRKLVYEEHELKVALIGTLGILKHNSVLPALQRALTDNDNEIVKTAIEALYEMNTPEAQHILDGLRS